MAPKSIIDILLKHILNTYLPIKIWLIKQSYNRYKEKLTSIERIENEEIFSHRSEDELANWIRKWLKRCPKWSIGHLELGRLSINAKKPELAYSSALAVRKISPKASLMHLRGTLLLGRVYLRSRKHQEAVELFNSINASRLNKCEQHILHEEQSTAHLLLEDFENAQKYLDMIGLDKLSSSNRMAYEFIQTKRRTT